MSSKLDHYQITDRDINLIVEMWKHFHPKDEPEILTGCMMKLNNKSEDVSVYQMLHVLASLTFNLYWHDRFYVQGFVLRTRKPVEMLYDHFLNKIKSPQEVKVIKNKFEEVEEEQEKVPKKKTSRKK